MGFYYLRLFLFVLCTIPLATLVNIIILFNPFNPVIKYLSEQAFSFLGRKIFGIKLEIRGYEKLKKNTPCVLISNHQHTLDTIIITALAPIKNVFLAKREILFIPFFGLPFWLIGNILINRTNRKNALRSMKKINRAVITKRQSVWIMPEGTRSCGKELLLPFKKGAFVTAATTNAPIVCICIAPFVKHINWNRLQSCTIIVDILDPIVVDKNNITSTKDFTYRLMRDKIKTLNREMSS